MKIALMVRRVKRVNGEIEHYKGDAVVNLTHQKNGVVFGFGEADADGFEISYEDIQLLADISKHKAKNFQQERDDDIPF